MSGSLCQSAAVEELQPSAPEAPRTLARVLHVINGEHYSGAERVQDLLALNLPAAGFEAAFACLKPGRFDALRASRQVPLRTLKMRGRWDLRPALQLARWIRQEKFSLVHTHSPRAAMIGRLAALLARVPMVHHVHSPTGRDSTRPLQDRLNATIERVSLAGATAVITVSRSLSNYIAAQGMPRARIHVVPNGVPTAGSLTKRDTPGGVWTIGTVALFRPRKGLEVLLEALARLRSDGHQVRLRAIGDFETPEYRAQTEQQVAQLQLAPYIEWTGFTRDVPGELARLDLFVLPSLFGEGLPMVVLEAMSAGVPVVATRVEGIPEAIRDRFDGLLADPNDPADLARAIAQYIRGEADWQLYRQHAHARQAEQFSDRSMARGVAEVYREVLGL